MLAVCAARASQRIGVVTERERGVRKRALFAATAIAMAGVLIFGGTAQAGRPGTGAVREATLTGTQVFPGPGDPDGTGQSKFIFYPNKNKICYTIQVSDIERATSAHLHRGSAGETGMVKLRLNPPADGRSEHECIRGLGERFIKKIGGNATDYYVDVHNDEHPDGALRGQLVR